MMRRLVISGLLALGGLVAIESTAAAQEIQLTGPLAGAPAVRTLRWHRNKRFEIAPTMSFTLLDEFQRTILIGARLGYNITDWLEVGLWTAFGAVRINTGLTTEINNVNQTRWAPDRDNDPKTLVDRNASVLNIGRNFPDQLGQITWVLSPQITGVPFRGKLAVFQKAFVDTEMYVFGGPAFVGIKERADFIPDKLQTDARGQALQPKYEMASRVAFSPTFGFGLTFFPGKWTGAGLEWRALPFAWNTSGFDSAGGPPDERGPDYKVDATDRTFRFNQMVTLSFNMYLPTDLKISP
jgi:hypothetical protein